MDSEKVKGDFANIVVGGMDYQYYVNNDVDYMLNLTDKSKYLDLKTNSVQKLDPENLTLALKGAMKDGKKVGYFASGTRMATADHYSNNTEPCKTEGASYAFFSPSDINGVYPAIDAIGKLFGFEESVINGIIEDFQLRLYALYHSVAEKSEGPEKPIVFWESGSGKAVKSSMAIIIVEFLGFNSKLLDGAEHDLESLLSEKPSMLIFYTNDKRPLTERMRAN